MVIRMFRKVKKLKKVEKVEKVEKVKTVRTGMLILAGLSSLALSGCAVMSNDFDCKKVGGIQGCVSLDQVYKMSNKSQLPGQNEQNKQVVSMSDHGSSDQANNNVSAPNQGALSGYNNSIPNIGQPVRFGDKIQQITIFPYQDSAGNYHEASIVYAVLKKSHWIDYPVSQVQTDDSEV